MPPQTKDTTELISLSTICTHACSFASVMSFCDTMNCHPPSPSVHGILQATILKWVAIISSRGSSRPRDFRSLMSSALASWFFTTSANWEAHHNHLALVISKALWSTYSVYLVVSFSHFNAFNICSYCFVYQLSLPSYCRAVSSVQLLSRVRLFVTPWTAERQASLSITNSWSWLKLISIKSVMPSNHVVPFSFCFLSFPASGSFPMSCFFTSDGQSTGVSASLPVNIQDWFPLRSTGWISLQSKGLSRVFSNTTVQKHQFFGAQLSL